MRRVPSSFPEDAKALLVSHSFVVSFLFLLFVCVFSLRGDRNVMVLCVSVGSDKLISPL